MEIGEICTREAHEAGAELNILHPSTGEETDLFIIVLGPDSREWRRAIKTDLTKLLAKKAQGITEEDLVDSDIDKLVSITSGWRGLTDKGAEVKFTKEKCKQLYSDSPRIMDQVDKFIGDSRNFTKG